MEDLLAQLVEQRPFKAWVLGSSPRGITKSLSEMRGFFDFDGSRRASVTLEDESQSEGNIRQGTISILFCIAQKRTTKR
jgi:hypothetical protein